MNFNHNLLNDTLVFKNRRVYGLVTFLTEVSVHAEAVGEDWLTRGGVPAGPRESGGAV